MSEFIAYFTENIDYIFTLFMNHIQYSLVATFIAIVIGVPLGIIIYNTKALNKPVLSLANLIQAIPSLAVLGFIVPYFGIGSSTAIFMVVIYSLLPILKNTYAGLKNINKETIQAARGIGMTNIQVLARVQIPLALPVIMAGIRISAVSAVGLMTIAAYIGADVLGSLVFSGINIDNPYMILSGAIPACILALFMDFIMGKVEKAVTPVSLQVKANNLTVEKIAEMKKSRRFTLAMFMTSIAVILALFVSTSFYKEADIVVSSKESVEGRIVGHIIAQTIEAMTDYTVEEKMGLGPTNIVRGAIKSGEIDIYPEYTGTLYTLIYDQEFIPGTPSEEVYETSKQLLLSEDNLYGLDRYNANNMYAMAVKPEVAEKYNLEKISDLQGLSGEFKVGGSPDFQAREDGIFGLEKMYGIEFEDRLSFSGTLMYTAIDNDEVDIIAAFTTDTLVKKYELVLLEDDMNFFAPYHIMPVATERMYTAFPDAVDALNSIAPLLDNEMMLELNGLVVEHQWTYEETATYFLEEIGVLK